MLLRARACVTLAICLTLNDRLHRLAGYAFMGRKHQHQGAASMAMKDWFSRPTPLQLALERGMQPGGDLSDELDNLGEISIESQADAEAVCGVLRQLALDETGAGGNSALHAIVGLFQAVDGPDCPAFPVMAERGIPLLVEIVNTSLENQATHDPDDILFALKILAMYGTSEGTDAVICAAQLPFQPDAFMWSVIFQAYSNDHPERERLFDELSDPLPTDFAAVSLLDSANAAFLAGAEGRHPFDSAAGIQQLEQWLADKNEEHFSYAVSTTAGLPFLKHPGRDALLARAFDHADADVQMEAAWAAAWLGRDAGVRWLARACLDVNQSDKAKRYLVELEREDAIPPEANDPDFQAKAAFAEWLAHPNELGRYPDELEVVDSRELDWPPDYESKPFWLIKYRVRDETGLMDDDIDVGLVGSVTFCLFQYKLEERPPEDCYAIHCYWEADCQGLVSEVDVPEGSNEFDTMLSQCAVDGLEQPRIIQVTELSPELNYPQRMVALAEAQRHGEPGWLVLDGPRSRWYAASELPDVSWSTTVLMLHVGRVLLKFTDEPDRRKYLQPPKPQRPPEQTIAAYERLLDQARSDADQTRKLLGTSSVLGSAFVDYVAALSAVRSESEAACTCTAYEALLSIAKNAEAELQSDLFDSFSPLGDVFPQYVDALVEMNRQAEVPDLIALFEPHLDHNLGYGMLGGAAFRSGHDALAERFLVKLRHSMEDWCRSEEMNDLAEIWCRQGRTDEAHTLLIDALKGLLEQSREATGSDRNLFEEWFQDRRSAYLKLFPNKGENELATQDIPPTTLSELADESDEF
jgi:hypothetical protein